RIPSNITTTTTRNLCTLHFKFLIIQSTSLIHEFKFHQRFMNPAQLKPEQIYTYMQL
ncbi:unnamed protein product, partial [Callosobruchus maculatus]